MADAKFTKYSMAPENPNNDGKHEAWIALGYDLGPGRRRAAEDVMRQLCQLLPATRVSGRTETEYGPRYSTRTRVVGPNGRTGTLVSVWQFDRGSEDPRMITHWLEVHEERGEE